jgi:hypothetical protein
MCRRLDALADHSIECWWLTSWTGGMRRGMDPFPGASWPVIADGDDIWRIHGSRWWKLTALLSWLGEHPDVTRLAWCDDHLRHPARQAMVRRALVEYNLVKLLLIAPSSDVGLTPEHMAELEIWAGYEGEEADAPTRRGT